MARTDLRFFRLPRAAIIPAVLLIVWQLVFWASGIKSDSLASPLQLLHAGVRALADGSLLQATLETLLSALGGLLIGAAVGLVLGLVLGASRVLDRLTDVSIEIIRPIPSIALVPLALLIYGFGYRMEILIVAFSTLWPMLLLTRSAVARVEPRLYEVARLLRLGPARTMRKVLLPAIAPEIFMAFRLATGVALIVAVTVEIAANPIGLGYAMMVAQQSLQPDRMFALLLWLGLLGWLINLLSTRMLEATRRTSAAASSGDKE